MLSKNLKELEEGSLVIRHQYNEIPPRVEYELSELSQKLIVALNALGECGDEYNLVLHKNIGIEKQQSSTNKNCHFKSLSANLENIH